MYIFAHLFFGLLYIDGDIELENASIRLFYT